MQAHSKISIITVCYNSAKTIEQTIQSVLMQQYPNLEYIIIDGASTDGTQTIVNKYADKISVFKSERDKGIYDAMNKGISLATGDIIGLLNADDLYAHQHVLFEVSKAFENDVAACYGDLIYFQQDNPKRSFVIGNQMILRKALLQKDGVHHILPFLLGAAYTNNMGSLIPVIKWEMMWY
ncbi:MAG: glycosyltransferase family 2 protein [Candidatus Berkiella sp.]